MPKSRAELAMAGWRTGLVPHPKPRRGMGQAARKLWQEIVEARPASFFMPGSQNLLRTYCEVSVVLEQLGPRLVAEPDDPKLAERISKLGMLQGSLAARLRISIQSALRGDRAANFERTEPPPVKDPELFGGKRAWKTKAN
jgi:hypothetical protein